MHTINPGTPRITTPLKGEVDKLKAHARDPAQDKAEASRLYYKGIKRLLGTAAVAISGIALFKISYSSYFSPSLDTHNVSNSVYKNFHNEYHGKYSLDCNSLALKTETLFFNLFESNEYLSSLVGKRSDDINGALQGFLEDRNLNAFKCTYHTYKKEAPRREIRARMAAEITGTPYKPQDSVTIARDKLFERIFKRFERADSDKFAKFLIDEGVNPNHKFDSIKPLDPFLSYSTPLLHAYEHIDESMMNTLLESGAEPEAMLSIVGKGFSASIYQDMSTLDYVVDQTSQASSELFCFPNKIAIQMMIPFHSSCKSGLESFSCKHLRHSIPKQLVSGSVCIKFFKTDTYFTQSTIESILNTGSYFKSMALPILKNAASGLNSILLKSTEEFWSFYEDSDKWNHFYKEEPQSEGSQNSAPPPLELTQSRAEKNLGLVRGDYNKKQLTKAFRIAARPLHPDITKKKVQKLPENEQEAAKKQFLEEYYQLIKSRDTLLEVNYWD